jgi:hypothetical protein
VAAWGRARELGEREEAPSKEVDAKERHPGRGRGRRGAIMDPRQQAGPGAVPGPEERGAAARPVCLCGQMEVAKDARGEGMVSSCIGIVLKATS